MHPLGVGCPLAKVPLVLLEHGKFLLALVTTPTNPVVPSLAPLPFVPPTPAQGPKGSIGHPSHASSSLLMHTSLASSDLGRMANLKLVDKQVKELVELKLQVLAEVRTSSG